MTNFRTAKYDEAGIGIDAPNNIKGSDVQTLSAIQLDKLQKQFDAVPTSKSLTAVGTYAGTGAAVTINVGWVPDLFFIKDLVAGTVMQYVQRQGGWLEKTIGLAGVASITSGITINIDGTVSIGTDASINTNTNNYEWFAYKENNSGSLVFCNHAGNDQPSRVLKYAEDRPLKAAIWKRDSTQLAVLAFIGRAARRSDGSVSTTAVINNDGTVTVGQGADINQWTSNLGEGTNFIGILDGAKDVYATVYTGTGASKPIVTPFKEIEAILIFPRANTTLGGAFWTSRLAAGTTLAVDAVSAATVGAQVITAVNNGRITLGTSGRANAAATEYLLIAFRKNRNGVVFENDPTARPMRSTKHLLMSSNAYVNCGTSDSLRIDGAITMEWWGAHFFATPTSYPTSATKNDNVNLQQPLIWRSNVADAVEGNVSYGMLIQPAQSTGIANPLGVALTNFFDFPQNAASYDVDDTQPWCTGQAILPRTPNHILVTGTADGFWRVYVNGQLVKERDRNMAQASPPRTNVVSYAGHSFTINARKRASTPEMASYFQAFYGARVYNRALTPAEALQNYNSLFTDNSQQAVADYVEQWLAENCTTAATLPATVNSANNGTSVGTVALEGI